MHVAMQSAFSYCNHVRSKTLYHVKSAFLKGVKHRTVLIDMQIDYCNAVTPVSMSEQNKCGLVSLEWIQLHSLLFVCMA